MYSICSHSNLLDLKTLLGTKGVGNTCQAGDRSHLRYLAFIIWIIHETRSSSNYK